MNIDEQIKRMKRILDISEEETPKFLNGLLIPKIFIEEFYWILSCLSRDAKDSKKYFNQIMEMTQQSQESVNDFVSTLCKGLVDGSIKF